MKYYFFSNIKMQSETKEFYEKILQNYTIKALVKSPGSVKGNNFISAVSKVQLTCISEDQKEEKLVNFILKEKENNAFSFLMDVAFKNECFAYQTIIPTLNKFSCKPIAVPKSIYSDNDFILLEDLTFQGFFLKRKSRDFTLQQITSILKELANLHASSIVMQSKAKQQFELLEKGVCDLMFGPDRFKVLLENQKSVLDLAFKVLNEENSEQSKNAIKLKKKIEDPIKNQVESINKNRAIKVINHGDLWSSNIMLNEQNAICFIDLQVMRCTSVAADLTYFLYSNIHPDIRKNNLKNFLSLYLEELKKNVSSQSVNSETLTFEWLEEEMKDFRVMGFMFSMWMLPLFLKENEEKTFDGSNTTKISAEYKERILKLIYEFVNK